MEGKSVGFVEFWSQWQAPSKYRGSKARSARLFDGLPQKKQGRVMESIVPYFEFLAEKENEFRQPMMCSTYLNHRNQHWETFAPDTAAEQPQDRDRRMAAQREHQQRMNEYYKQRARERYEALTGKPYI